MPGRHVFRPASAMPLAVGAAVVVVLLLGDALVRGGVGETLLLAPWPLLALWAVYVSAYASALVIDDEGVTVQNMLRVIRIPWARVADIRWDWQVDVFLDDGSRVRSIGGPSQSRSARRPLREGHVPAAAQAQFDALLQVFARSRERVQGVAMADAAVRRGWDVPGLAALAVLVVWAIVAVLLTGTPQ